MNVLMIGELYKFGGASEIMEILAQGLERRGHKVLLVYGYNYGGQSVEDKHYVMFNNSYLRRINNKFRFIFEKYNLNNIYAESYIDSIVRKNKIDIIHLHAMQGGFLYLTAIEKICKKYNIVWTVHDTWPITGGCMYYWDCFKWKDKGCIDCEETDLQMKYLNAEVNLKRKRAVLQNKGIYFVAPSEWMFANLKSSFMKNETIIKIENGINLEIFKPLTDIDRIKEKYKVNKNKKILMFNAGSVTNKYKGWKYLQGALCSLKNQENYELLIVGKESEDISRLRIAAKVVGYVNDKKVLNELYNIADIFILPSVQDNFPTVTLEAQAAGTPVLAFSIGGIKQQVCDETGWLLSRVCSEALSHAIEDIFESANWKYIVKNKGENARKRCLLLYDAELMAERYEKIYREKVNYA